MLRLVKAGLRKEHTNGIAVAEIGLFGALSSLTSKPPNGSFTIGDKIITYYIPKR